MVSPTSISSMDWFENYRKNLYLMRKAMVSSRSSLQPNWGAHLVMGKA
jgi:hypothetical protein